MGAGDAVRTQVRAVYWMRTGQALCARCADPSEDDAVREGTEGAGGEPLTCGGCGEAVGNRLDHPAMEALIARLRRYDPRHSASRRERRALTSLARAYAEVIAEEGRVDIVLTKTGGWVGRRVQQRQRDIVAMLNECAREGPAASAVRSARQGYVVVAVPDIAQAPAAEEPVWEDVNPHRRATEHALWTFARAHFMEAEIEKEHDGTLDIELEATHETDAPGRAYAWARRVQRAMRTRGGASEGAQAWARAEHRGSGFEMTNERRFGNGQARTTWRGAVEVEDWERENAIEHCDVPVKIERAVRETESALGAYEAHARTMHGTRGTRIEVRVRV